MPLSSPPPPHTLALTPCVPQAIRFRAPSSSPARAAAHATLPSPLAALSDCDRIDASSAQGQLIYYLFPPIVRVKMIIPHHAAVRPLRHPSVKSSRQPASQESAPHAGQGSANLAANGAPTPAVPTRS